MSHRKTEKTSPLRNQPERPPVFTIITPTYNRAYLIERTINSILAQTYNDWEYIIIDDGSTDNTEEVVQKYLNDSRIRYIKKENTGAAHSRNVSALYAKGEYVVFLDSDDDALPEWLEVAAGHVKEDVGIICAGAVRKLSDGTSIEEYPYEINVYGRKEKVKFTCGSLFMKRQAFLDIKGYDLDMPSGLQSELGYRLIQYLHDKSLKIASIHQCLVQIYIHEGPRLRTDWHTLTAECVNFVAKNYDYFRKWDPKELSNNYTVIAFYYYKSRNRKTARSFLAKAIRFNPLRLSNYVRMLKYSFA